MTNSKKSFAPTWIIVLSSIAMFALIAWMLLHGDVRNLSSFGGY